MAQRRTAAPSVPDAVGYFHEQFERAGSAARARQDQAYMKSALRFHGVVAATVRAHCKLFCDAHPELSREQLRAVAGALYDTDWFDLRSAAIGSQADKEKDKDKDKEKKEKKKEKKKEEAEEEDASDDEE